ncbi:MAG: AMP nucleosidase [Desulfobulbaceae bacterium]|nr:AMP nucleosidase [Desulfobulbaceae bacterium]MCK5404267.1 AMP nucleosidase [Desulfobulbaceae bacterium]
MKSQLRPDSYARHTLERYTGSSVEQFGSYVLLCNFPRYIDDYTAMTKGEIQLGHWSVVHDPQNDISIINYGVGSPSAGIVMHCLSYLDHLECVLMLGMCGGIDDDLEVGDILIPSASIRDEGTSRHYLPKDVPALPQFWINRICEEMIIKELDKTPKSGIMLTTDYRMWEFDDEFIEYILKHRIMAIDMELATLFSVGYALDVPTGSLMLVSDLPLKKGGIKSKDSAEEIFHAYTAQHLKVGVKILKEIKARKKKRKKRGDESDTDV